MTEESDCGCDCDNVLPEQPLWHAHLSDNDLKQLIEEKISRVRRQREMMARLDGQLESD